MRRGLIAARLEGGGLVPRLAASARTLAEARRTRGWNSPRGLWPLFTGDRHA